MRYFISAIHTDSGKTLASAIVAQALQADYWKPIQSGLPKDADTVKNLVSFDIKIHPSAYEFAKPASPHDAAKAENREINLENIVLPQTENTLLIEGAGGLLVPLNDTDFVVDIPQKLDVEIIFVVNIYLGCINHSLLSFEAMKHRNLKVKGIIFNGEDNPETKRIILHHAGWTELLHIHPEKEVTPEIVVRYAEKLSFSSFPKGI